MAKPDANTAHVPLSTLAVVVLTVAVLYFAKQILLPIALAALLSFLLTPLVNRLERTGIGRVASVVAAVAFSLALFSILGWILANQMVALSSHLPEYRRNLIAKVRSVRQAGSKLDEVKKTIEEVGKELTAEGEADTASDGDPGQTLVGRHDWVAWLSRPQAGGQGAADDEDAVEVKVVQMPPSPLTQIHDWLGPLVAPMTSGGIVIVLVLFILIQREDIRDRIILLFGTTHLHTTTEAINEAASRVSRYLRMHLLINACYGVGVGVGLSLIGLPNALLWGAIGLLLRFLPYLGPWIAASMPILLSLAVSSTWSTPLLVIGLFVVLELIVNNVLEPLLYGSSVGVSSVGIVVAAVFWTWLWGPIGLVLAVPLTVCLVVTGQYVPRLRFFVVLFSDRSTLSDAERLYQRLLAGDYEEAERRVVGYAANHGLDGLFESVLLPALELAERDRHDGILSEDAAEFILESSRDLIAGAVAAIRDESQSSDSKLSGSAPVLCIPAEDDADELAALMLAKLLAAEGISAEVAATESLTSEYADRVADLGCELAVISILPPIQRRKGRYLLNRLRGSRPDLPVVIGAWRSADEHVSFDQLSKTRATYVVGTLSAAVSQVRTLVMQQRIRVSSSTNGNRDAT